MNLFDWMARWAKPRDDEQAIKAVLGRLLFSSDEIKKRVKVLSGGEQGRMLFGKLMLQQPNIMILDEPPNHLDMESIEALNLALENYPGTLLLVRHDREFVSSLATRILEHAVALHLLVEREVFHALHRLFHKQGIKRQLHGLSVLHLVGAGHAAGLIIDERETFRVFVDAIEAAGEGPIVSITAFGLHLHFAHAP